MIASAGRRLSKGAIRLATRQRRVVCGTPPPTRSPGAFGTRTRSTGRLHSRLAVATAGHRGATIRSWTAAEAVFVVRGAVVPAVRVDGLRARVARAAPDGVGRLRLLDQMCWRSVTGGRRFCVSVSVSQSSFFSPSWVRVNAPPRKMSAASSGPWADSDCEGSRGASAVPAVTVPDGPHRIESNPAGGDAARESMRRRAGIARSPNPFIVRRHEAADGVGGRSWDGHMA